VYFATHYEIDGFKNVLNFAITNRITNGKDACIDMFRVGDFIGLHAYAKYAKDKQPSINPEQWTKDFVFAFCDVGYEDTQEYDEDKDMYGCPFAEDALNELCRYGLKLTTEEVWRCVYVCCRNASAPVLRAVATYGATNAERADRIPPVTFETHQCNEHGTFGHVLLTRSEYSADMVINCAKVMIGLKYSKQVLANDCTSVIRELPSDFTNPAHDLASKILTDLLQYQLLSAHRSVIVPPGTAVGCTQSTVVVDTS